MQQEASSIKRIGKTWLIQRFPKDDMAVFNGKWQQ